MPSWANTRQDYSYKNYKQSIPIQNNRVRCKELNSRYGVVMIGCKAGYEHINGQEPIPLIACNNAMWVIKDKCVSRQDGYYAKSERW